MSHFTVLVIGENPEAQLEPFDESIEAPEYQRELVSESEIESFIKTYQNHDPERKWAKITEAEAEANKLLSFDELYQKYGDDWNNNQWRKNEAGEWAEFTTYNPKSKWDWYQLGGRWNGFLKLNPMKAIGFGLEGFSTAEVDNLVDLFLKNKEKFMDVTSKYNGKTGLIRETIANIVDFMENPTYPEHVLGDFSLVSDTRADKGWCDQALKKYIDFDGMRDKAEKEARERYNEVLIAFGGVIPKVEIKWEDVTDFDCTLEEYIQQARDNSTSTFAILKDGVWYEKGKMGWWACVTDAKEQSDWNNDVTKLIDELSDDTLISLYDCHI